MVAGAGRATRIRSHNIATEMDVEANRASRKWSRKTQTLRVLWALAWPLFALSPRPLWGWRRLLLRLFGAKVGRETHVYPTVRITMPWNLSLGNCAAVGDHAIIYALGRIQIGHNTTVSQGAHLCAGTHDLERSDRALLTPPITVEDNVWICADAFVGPGVTIRVGAIVGARAVVMKDIPSNTIVAGNPATVVRIREVAGTD